ncbi:uncharacterized protein [Panulirus ornatus]|uniref:uncharacterized protein n=1 Tax=Panulirus ornatus TaxID=150431 RepID=UPI003A8BBC0A
MFGGRREVFALWLLQQYLLVISVSGVSVEGDVGGREAEEFPKCANVSDIDNMMNPAPDYLQTLQGSFSLVLEMTLMRQKKTYYVEEVRERTVAHGHTIDTGSVHIRHNGSLVSYYYYPPDGAMVEEMDGVCRLVGTGVPPFHPWGWWDPEPSHGDMLYGPSTMIRLSHFFNKRYLGGHRVVNGVLCQRWEACEGAGEIEVYYYFSENPWQMAEAGYLQEGGGSFPIQWEVMFMDASERVQYNIFSFLPFLHDTTLSETPRGESCEGMVSQVPGAILPRIPTHFSLYQEVVTNPSIDGRSFGTQTLIKVKLTYNHPWSLIRLDYRPILLTDTPYYTTDLLIVIHDFNTGVQYVIDSSLGNCTRGRIPRNFFDNNLGGMFGTGDTMLTPDQLFHLDDSYALVGSRSTRGISSDLWTSTRSDIPDLSTGGLQNYPKAVLEYYFTKSYESTPEGIEEVDTPLRSDLFVYNTTDPQQVAFMVTTNIYDFNVVKMYTEDEFRVEECFEADVEDEWSYVVVVFPTTTAEDMEAVSENEDLFRGEVFSLVAKYGQMSPVRIASIDVSIGIAAPGTDSHAANVILASLKVLDKAPYILSYVEPMDTLDPVPGVNEPKFEDITSAADCAELCSLEKNFKCRSFHHCGGDTCYLSRTEASDGEPDYSVQGCHLWVQAVANQSLPDLPTDQAYSNLLTAIMHDFITIFLIYEGKGFKLTASEALHYRTPDPLAPIRSEFSLESRRTVLRYPDDALPQITSQEECMTLCISWRAYRCLTIAYLSKQQECRLSATPYGDLSSSALKPQSDSDVFSRTYLSEYSPVLGGVALNISGLVYSNVGSLETCARYCSEEKSIDCRSFEWCHEEQACHLHPEHFLDVVDSGNYTTHASCIHFSTKMDQSFSQHPTQGMTTDQHTLRAVNSDASACAKICLEEASPVCESFDFCSSCDNDDYEVCGEVNAGTRNLCFTGTHHLGEPGVQLASASHCRHYSREYFGEMDYASWVESRGPHAMYAAGDMTGLAIGMLVLGALLVIGFLYALIACSPEGTRPPQKDPVISFVNLQLTQGESES